MPSGGGERVMGSSYNTDEDSLTGLQLTSCCGGLVPNRPRTGTGPEAVLVLWTTSLNAIVGHSVKLPPCFLPFYEQINGIKIGRGTVILS